MNINKHFSKISQMYRNLRITDLEPILYMSKLLQKLPKIKAASIGCGSGRYELMLFQYLGNKLHLFCIDNNKQMLLQLKEYFKQQKIQNFQIKQSVAKQLPLENESLDCVFTFNAIHHFNIFGFVNEVSRVLKDKGYLFIYTRTRTQNSRNIWGKYFPLFNQKETRLYELYELKSILREVPELVIQNVEFFKYQRVSYFDWLVEQARNNHYSTFYLYSQAEFQKSLDKFKRNLQRHFMDLNNISWFDENVLLVIRKHKFHLFHR